MKTTISQISNFLNEIFPLEKAELWDKSGFSFYFNNIVSKIIICIDLTPDILTRALQQKVNLIITHHPFLFYKTKKENYQFSPYKKTMVKAINQAKISVFSLHTNYDSNNHATARAILSSLDLQVSSTQAIDDYNLLVNTNIKFLELVSKVKNTLNLKHLQTNLQKNLTIKKLAILPGSAGIEAVLLAKKHKADLVITSDLKWSDQLAFVYKKVNVLLVSHLIEQFFVFDIKAKLEQSFKNSFDIKIELLEEILYNL
ncbi:Nif3-like dinuclear metal center hexameric protein [Mesomycoplasma hyorhinis]|uniref:Nif3-like dinuclear metal center hexameric protein n=1 Tax=Mesomycoplasma hyorhinis TaxID=2100 RepID=UPI001C057C71|nr:Nif3-like dinuclear metal center hexameric protein [Mesomycoplasma hyorhinis]